jgi:nucleotide-binding universal stress UspA family protein
MRRSNINAGVAQDADSAVLIFSSVLCSIDGSPADEEAARQAAILAGPGGKLEFLATTREWGYGANSRVTLGFPHARKALHSARAIARELGVEPHLRTVEAGSRVEALMAATNGHGLVVVGDDGATRAQGIFHGATSSTLVHRSEGPVLIARRPPQGTRFPNPVLLADDGSQSAREAARIATRLAARDGSTIELISPRDIDRDRASVLATDAAAIYIAGGAEPVRVRETGRVADAIVSAAARQRVSLVVIGSRGLQGLPALASVSERVATRAPCSVLVAKQTAESSVAT